MFNIPIYCPTSHVPTIPLLKPILGPGFAIPPDQDKFAISNKWSVEPMEETEDEEAISDLNPSQEKETVIPNCQKN